MFKLLPRPGKLLCALRRDRRGVAALEFGLVGLPFLWMVVGIIEFGVIHLSAAGLENGLHEAGRVTRTGRAECMSTSDFKRIICHGSGFLPACQARLTISQHTVPVFNRAAAAIPAGALDDTVTATNGGDVVSLSVDYQYHWATPLIGRLVSQNGITKIHRGMLFQNEPFGTRATPCP